MRTFQHAEVFGSLTVEENMVVAARVPRDGHRELHESLEILGLASSIHVSAAQLSFGKRRLLGVAMAAATKPALLVLDEPTSGLNDAEAEELAAYLRTLHAGGLTLAIVDHHMEFLLPLCHQMLLLRSGEKLWEGTPQQFTRSDIVMDTYLGSASTAPATGGPGPEGA
jgi:branched-chain amino acid transport system ATP-binding protein